MNVEKFYVSVWANRLSIKVLLPQLKHRWCGRVIYFANSDRFTGCRTSPENAASECVFVPGESSTAALNSAISSSDICMRLRLFARSNTALTRSSQPVAKERNTKTQTFTKSIVMPEMTAPSFSNIFADSPRALNSWGVANFPSKSSVLLMGL